MYKREVMIWRVVVAGCRNYTDHEEAIAFLDARLAHIPIDKQIVILSGGADGADSIGEAYAREKGFPVEKYPADWKRYGKRAGPIRNRQMAQACDLVICFWDGQSRGTGSMIQEAKKANKPLVLKRIDKKSQA